MTGWASGPDGERLYSLVPGANARRAAGLPPAAAREEARKAAETAAAEKLAVAERAGVNLQAQLQQLLQDSETARATPEADAKARETEIRTQG